MKIGISTSRAISVEMEVVYEEILNDFIEIKIMLFSRSFTRGDVIFLYKKNKDDEWHNDACISYSNSEFRNENKLHGLPCSLNGSESKLIWNYTKNGIMFGFEYMIKAVVTPSLSIINKFGEFSRLERIFNIDRVIENGLPKELGKIVNLSINGDFITVGSNFVSVVDQLTHNNVFTCENSTNPTHAVGTPSGGLIMIQEDGMIIEYDSTGDEIESFDASSMAEGGSVTICLHDFSGNLLISGGDSEKVTELSWGGIDHGHVIWNYTKNGMHPTGAVYGDGLETILFCDPVNNKVFVIDRVGNGSNVTSISSVTVNGQPFNIEKPIACAMFNDNLHICESSGRKRSFNKDALLHPAMIRSGMVASNNVDFLQNVKELSSMTFTPIVRSIK